MTSTALASYADESTSSESDPFATSSTPSSSSSSSTPLFTPSPEPGTTSFFTDPPSSSSGGTPDYLGYTPASSSDGSGDLSCRAPPADASPALRGDAPPPVPPRSPPRTSGGTGIGSGSGSGPGRSPPPPGSAAPPASSTATTERADSPNAAATGAGARRQGGAGGGGQGGRARESAEDAEQRRQRDQTQMRLALPARQASRGVARIGRQPLFLATPSRMFAAPRTLEAPLPQPQPAGQGRQGAAQPQDDPASARRAYANAARESEAVYDRILAGAARLAREADANLTALTDRSETELGLALTQLEEDLAQRRLDAANRRDFTLNHVASRTDLLRFYVVEQANGALARMAALRKELLAEIERIRGPTRPAIAALTTARDQAYDAANRAHFAIQRLERNPRSKLATAEKFQQTEELGPMLREAMLEAAVHYGPPRFAADDQLLADRLGLVSAFADPLLACTKCEIDAKVYAIEMHAENLGVSGPRALRSARDSTLGSIDKAEQRLILTVQEAHRATDGALIDRHEQTRGILVAQAGQAMAATRRDIEGGGQRLIEALGSVAATQPSALSMVHEEIEKAAVATPTRAATVAVRASERLLRNTRNTAQRHPSTLLGRAERNQAARADRIASMGRDQKSLVSGFNGQEARLVSDSFDQVAQSVEESLFGMAGMPGQVGKTCDSMLRTARQALTEVKKTTKEDVDFIVEKLIFACDGLKSAKPPGATGTGTDSGHAPAPEPLMCTPGDEPNMSVFNPNASSSSMSSSSPLMSMAPNSSPMMSMAPASSPLMSVMPPASSSSTASTPPARTSGGAAAGPASCGTCESAQAAANGPAGPAGGTTPNSSTGGGTNGEADGAPAQASEPGDDVNVSSNRTEMRSPRAFKAHCDPIARNSLTAPTTADFINTVHDNLTGMLDARCKIAKAALDRTGETDYAKLFKDCLRGLTRTQGRAFTERYQKMYHRDLASEIRAHAHDSLFTAYSTDIYNSEAAVAALEGRAVDGAMDELRAAFNFSNETGRIFEIMQNLSQDQMAELLRTHETELRELMGQLSTADQARFDLLMHNRTVRARSTELKTAVDQTNSRYRTGRDSERRGFELGTNFADAENPAGGRWALEGAADRVDVFGLEDPGVRQARERQHWREIQEDFVNLDGVAEEIARANPDAAQSRPDDPPGAALLAYATRPLTYRVYQPYQQAGETREQALDRQRRDEERYGATLGEEDRDQYGYVGRTATTTLSEYQMLALQMAVIRGSQSREARAARALAQLRRRDGVPPDYKDMEKSLHSGLGDAREMGNFEHAPPDVVDRDRLQTFVMMERFRRQIEGGATGPIDGSDARAMFRSEIAFAYRNRPDDLDVALGVIDSDAGNMQAVIDQAIRREDPALLNRYLGRMDSQQIEQVITEWNERHPGGPGLREKLGVGRGNHWSITNWNGAVFSGDEANALEIAMMGVPQNPLQKAEVQHRIVQQQIEQAGWLGKLLCSDEYDEMVENARHLREVMGVTESQFDDNGRVIVTDPETGERIKFNFDASGQFVPARGGDVTLFQSLLATTRIVADNYTSATDRMASFITTGIAIIVGAILSVCTLGMGTAIAIALIAGALTIAVNASMRGGRYSRDDFTRDLVSAAVQAVTAGVGAGIQNVARGAQAAALAGKAATATFTRGLSVGQRLLLTASRHPIVMGAAMGAFSNGVTTALDPAMRRREDYGDQVWNAIFRGGAGGAVTAGVMHGITTGGSALAQRYAASRAMAYALQRGASNEVAMRFAARASLAALRSKTVEVGLRTFAGGTAGMLGRGAEMGYENTFAHGRHTSEDFFREMRNAFIHSAAQNFLEGVGGRYKRTSTAGGIEEDRMARQMQRGEAYEHAARAFDRESARMGLSPRGTGGTPGEGAPPPARGVQPDEQPAPPRPPAANDNEPGAPLRRAVGDEDIAPGARLRDDDEGPRLRTQGDEDDLRLRTHRDDDDGPRLRSGDSDDVDRGAITQKIPVLKRGLADLNADTNARPLPIYDDVDLTPGMLRGSKSIPEDSRIRATNPHSEEAALANYHTMREADLHREVLLAKCINPADERYGQYMVIQGGEDSVRRPPDGWIAERHSHPRLVDTATSAERLVRSLPSGEGADFGVLRREVDMLSGLVNSTKGVTRESVIDIRLGEQHHETHFSITRNGDSYEYRVSFRPPHDGVSSLGPFRSLADYETAAGNLTGQKWGKGRQERMYTADAGGTVSASRPRAVHGEALTPSMRQDIEFVAGRMALSGEFEGQAAGTRPRTGDLDPVIARAATLEDAHARVVRMGLVGEPDSMIRLHNILNDDSIPLATRELISDVTLAATRNHLIRTGELEPGEPLVILFHGASSERTTSLVKEGVDFARHRPGGRDDDFGEGLYLTQSLETGLKYRDRRSASDGGGRGAVIPYLLRGRDLGDTVNVSTGGSLRAQWEAFAVANARTLVNNLGDSMMFTELLGRIMTGRVTRFAEFDETLIRNRGQLFNDFLASVGKRPDVIFGDLGGPLTHGIALRNMTDQAVVRTQSVGDIMNRQHVRAGTADSDVTTGGPHALGTAGDDTRLRTEPLRPVTREGPAPGSPQDPAERAAMRRRGPEVDEINAAQRALRKPSKDGVRGAIAAVRRGGPDAAAAQERLNRLYDTPDGAVIVDISDARIKRLADGLKPGQSHDVLVEGMWLRLYRAQATDANPNPRVRYDASVPPHVPGQPRRVYQFGSGELRVWRATPTRDEPAGRLIQSSLVSAGKERAGLEDNMFSHGESYERTAQTPIGPQAAGYHGTALERGHLHGAGLGMESPFGIGLVPREVNQTLQNRGIEGWMRRLRDALPPGAELIYSTDVSWHKTSNRHSRIGYRLDVVIQGRRVPFAEFAIHVEADLPWTPQAQRRGTTGVFVSPLEFRTSGYPRVDNYFRALREIVDTPEVLHSGLARAAPGREEIGRTLHQLQPDEIRNIARAAEPWELESHNPARSSTFSVKQWERGLTRILDRDVRPRYIVVDLRGQGLKPLQKEQIGRALERLSERDQRRILLLDDNASYSTKMSPVFRSMLLAAAEDDDT